MEDDGAAADKPEYIMEAIEERNEVSMRDILSSKRSFKAVWIIAKEGAGTTAGSGTADWRGGVVTTPEILVFKVEDQVLTSSTTAATCLAGFDGDFFLEEDFFFPFMAKTADRTKILVCNLVKLEIEWIPGG